MSFNILHGATVKNDFNLDTIAGVINSYNPDLVALQEVDFKSNSYWSHLVLCGLI